MSTTTMPTHRSSGTARVRNATMATLAALLVILGLTAGGNTDNAVNGSGSSSVSVSGTTTQPDIETVAATTAKYKFAYADGGRFYFKRATGGLVELNPNGYSFVQNRCYNITTSGSTVTGRTQTTC